MKKPAPKPVPTPVERRETVRREIASILEQVGPLSAREISMEAGIRENEVCGHLEHIKKSISRKSSTFEVTPAECGRCGFVFRTRTRLTKPGRCPSCRSEDITEPLFSIIKKD